MQIEVYSDEKHSQYDQFDPFKLKQLKLYASRVVEELSESKLLLGRSKPNLCEACGDEVFENSAQCRAALRRVLIGGKPRKF
ncbi:MAG: hypothetical protein ACREXR_06550 [Gammaproteobacteria bacterium]